MVAVTNAVPSAEVMTWAAMERADYHEFVRRLRSVLRMPEDYILAIVTADLRRQLKHPTRATGRTIPRLPAFNAPNLST